jgi:hypothetical protein
VFENGRYYFNKLQHTGRDKLLRCKGVLIQFLKKLALSVMWGFDTTHVENFHSRRVRRCPKSKPIDSTTWQVPMSLVPVLFPFLPLSHSDFVVITQLVCATTHLHALFGWSFIVLVAAKCGVVLTHEQLVRMNQWTSDEQRNSDQARDVQQRISEYTREAERADQRSGQQRLHDALPSSRRFQRLGSERAHTVGYQAMPHQSIECMCFFKPVPAATQSASSSSSSSKPARPKWMCTLCNNASGTADRAAHNKGVNHRKKWEAREDCRPTDREEAESTPDKFCSCTSK